MLIVVGARWGAEVGTSHKLEELEERLRLVEDELRQRSSMLEAAATSCVTRVVETETGSLQLLRSDGSEAGRVGFSPSLPPRAGVQTAVEFAAASTAAAPLASGSTEVQAGIPPAAEAAATPLVVSSPAPVWLQPPLGAAPTDALAAAAERHPPGSAAARAAGRRGAVATSPGPSGTEALAGEEPQLRVATAQVRVAQARATSVAYPELTCKDVLHKQWLEVKALTAAEFEVGMGEEGRRARLQALVDRAVRSLSSSQSNADECGMGRLCMSLLAIAAGTSAGDAGVSGGGSLLSAYAVHSPLLTVLLDVPWRLVLSSGWPLFAILAWLSQLRDRREGTPLAAGPAADYFAALHAGLERREAHRLAQLGAEFLRSAEGRAHASTHVMPGLCALASQLLSPEVGSGGMPVDTALKQVQGFFRQAVQSIEDIQGTLDSAWPLYRVLSLAAATLELG